MVEIENRPLSRLSVDLQDQRKETEDDGTETEGTLEEESLLDSSDEYDDDPELDEQARMWQRVIMCNLMARQKVDRMSRLEYQNQLRSSEGGSSDAYMLSTRLSVDQRKLLTSVQLTKGLKSHKLSSQ